MLKAYIVDPAAYVYWSTPRLYDEIAVGDTAYIIARWTTRGSSRPAASRSARACSPRERGRSPIRLG